jgi:hypothetical protein
MLTMIGLLAAGLAMGVLLVVLLGAGVVEDEWYHRRIDQAWNDPR